MFHGILRMCFGDWRRSREPGEKNPGNHKILVDIHKMDRYTTIYSGLYQLEVAYEVSVLQQ